MDKEYLMQFIVWVDEIPYKMKDVPLHIGDLAIDTVDGQCGVVETVNEHCVSCKWRDNFFVCLVPERMLKLTPTITDSQIN